ncbi:MAG: helicase, partial [Gemmatimonadetes bacterium]|nr:helicase [Gemmatimonadota bacterium]
MDIPLRLAPAAARAIRDEVARAGGREVSFLAEVTRERVIANPRAVARGNRSAVLAVARDAPDGGVMIHNHPSGELDPSDADLAVAARIYERGLGTAIVNNEANRIYVVVEPPVPRDVEPLRVGELSGLLAPEGPLAKLPGYEDRPGQRDMLRFVASHFNEGGVGLVEAGTGTGKALAYLVPAARWATRND